MRVPVEWVFKEIIWFLAFMDFKKNQKVQLSAVGKMYNTCALLTNVDTCLYKSQTTDMFGIEPPLSVEYFTRKVIRSGH